MSWGFGLIAAGLCFLWNPMVNVIDVLPDAFGWMLLALGMTTLSYLREDLYRARKRAWVLTGISFLKFLPMYWSLCGAAKFPLAAEPTMVLTYTVCFAMAEFGLGLSVFLPLLGKFSELGLLGDSENAIRGIDELKFFTVWLFLSRAVGSIVPELVYLRSTEYLGNIVYGVVIDIRDYRPYLIVFCVLCALISGAAWLIVMLRYFMRLRRDPAFDAAFRKAAEDGKQEILCRGTLERFAVSFAIMFIGGIFFTGLTFESVRILPDAVGVFLTLGGLMILGKFRKPGKKFVLAGIGVGIAAAAYWGYGVWHTLHYRTFWADNVFDYFRRDIAVNAEKQANGMRMQLVMLALSVVMTVLLILYFRRFLSGVQALDGLTLDDGVTLYDSMTANMMRAEREKYAKQPRDLLLWFIISAGTEVVGNLPVFAFVITPFTFIRLILNIIFLVKFYLYLEAKYKVISCHYQYNTANA